ncbi:MAG: GNAT family N-acetyltransferase, partial [Pseudomonadota bacterium]
PPRDRRGRVSLALRRDDALGPAALAMIAGSEGELAALYPPHLRFAFDPEELRAARVRFLVAERDAAPVGCGGVAPLARYGELKRIYVVPAARGSGVADAIVAALEGIARAEGLPLMRLETGAASPAAIAFYARMGYRRCAPFGDYAENGSSVFMEKPLA